ncbi:uncharacterized protein LOC129617532 [Condylostylus longicornis]|uniref:uncharacterized protein LOC129617532 n=1 Tax=Condylostylus longicornis TaxID=2530218 RepID=UPI00244DE377|nr:uncharacterized protein LOC129617532 [Condylostylus longicornis]
MLTATPEKRIFLYCGDVHHGKRDGCGRLYGLGESDELATVERVIQAQASEFRLIYDGMWEQDLPHGWGIGEIGTGRYEGAWREGKREGMGKYVKWHRPIDGISEWSRGFKMGFSTYDGEWKDDLPDGVGVFMDQFGREIRGRFSEGKYDGKVLRMSKNVKKVTGESPWIKSPDVFIRSDLLAVAETSMEVETIFSLAKGLWTSL